MSDDLRMGAIQRQYGMGEAAVMAVTAQLALETVCAALAKGTLDIARVEAALERVRSLRGRLNQLCRVGGNRVPCGSA